MPNHLIIHNSKSIGLPGIASQQLHAQSAGVVSVRQFCQMLSWPREADFEDALEQCRGGSQGRGALVCAEAQCPPRAHSEPAPGEFSTVQCMEWTLSVRGSPRSVLTVGGGGTFPVGLFSIPSLTLNPSSEQTRQCGAVLILQLGCELQLLVCDSRSGNARGRVTFPQVPVVSKHDSAPLSGEQMAT